MGEGRKFRVFRERKTEDRPGPRPRRMGKHGRFGSGRNYVGTHPRRASALRAFRTDDTALKIRRHDGGESPFKSRQRYAHKQGIGKALFALLQSN